MASESASAFMEWIK